MAADERVERVVRHGLFDWTVPATDTTAATQGIAFRGQTVSVPADVAAAGEASGALFPEGQGIEVVIDTTSQAAVNAIEAQTQIVEVIEEARTPAAARPRRTAAKDEWVAYVVAQGVAEQAEAEGLTKDELIALTEG